MPVLVDSSGWIEFVQGGANAQAFVPALQDHTELIVPTVVVCEVTRFLRRELSEDSANLTLARMEQSIVVDLDLSIAIEAARIGLFERLALADSIILSTARRYGAVLWTQDAHFQHIAGVRFFPKPVN